jgi:hypothetical protein
VVAEASARAAAVTTEASVRSAADAAIIASGNAPANVGIAPVIATGTTTPLSVADHLGMAYNVMAFGALGDGTTNDAPAIQACIDAAIARGAAGYCGAKIVVPPAPGGFYRINTGLRIEPTPVQQVFVNFVGLGAPQNCAIRYFGSASGVALTVKNNARYTIENLFISDATGAGGSGVLLSSKQVGSAGGGTLRNVTVVGFDEGFSIGESGGQSTSEILMIRCEAAQSVTGFAIRGQDTLNIWMIGCGGVVQKQLIRAYYYSTAPAVDSGVLCLFMLGGSGGYEKPGPIYGEGGTEPWLWMERPGQYTFENVYMECTEGKWARVGPATPVDVDKISPYRANVAFRNCQYIAATSHLSEWNTNGTLTIEGGAQDGWELNGHPTLYGNKNSIIARNAVLTKATPFAWASGRSVFNVRLEGCGFGEDNDQSTHADEHFVILSDGTKRSLYSYPWNLPYTDFPTAQPTLGAGVLIGAPLAYPAATAVSPANGGTYSPDTTMDRAWELTAGAGVAGFTVGAITPQLYGMVFRIRLKNASGGALAVTWHSSYKLPTWANLANGKSRTYEFENTANAIVTCLSVGPDVDN